VGNELPIHVTAPLDYILDIASIFNLFSDKIKVPCSRKVTLLLGAGEISVPPTSRFSLRRLSRRYYKEEKPMNSALRTPLLMLVFGTAFGVANNSHAATIAAANCSLTSVQTAVNTAVDGDKVVIPDGSCAWSGGISTNKQIKIEAQSYTPTPRGTMTRSVTITNNSSAPLFSMQSGNNYNVGVSGIRFNEGTGSANAIKFTGSGSKVPLLNDCSFQNKQRNGSAADVALISWLAQGGVAWNIYIDGTGFGSGGDPGPTVGSVSVHFKSPRAWYTASTLGTLDTNGNINVYIEDSTFINTGGGDLDDNARVVMRHCTFDGSVWITHGFTSTWGGRFWESYNNTYQVTSALRNHAGMYFWARAGHGIFTDNIVNNASAPQNYGNPSQLRVGDNTKPTGYPQARQPGWGHNGTSNVIDPIYIWNNTGGQAYSYQIESAWSSNFQLNRELFVNSGPKPGYSKYQYPHPLRSGSSSTNSVLPPETLRVQ
jgi:hypothetical protein